MKAPGLLLFIKFCSYYKYPVLVLIGFSIVKQFFIKIFRCPQEKNRIIKLSLKFSIDLLKYVQFLYS